MCVVALLINNSIQHNTILFIILNKSVRTSKKTQHFTITKMNCVRLFKEIIGVYIENVHIQNTNLLIINAMVDTVTIRLYRDNKQV
jgi:hypothetical protein